MAENFLDHEQLVDLGVAREQRLAIHELSHDAADGPNVNLFAVWQVVRYQKELGWSVPSGRDIVRKFGCATAMLIVAVGTLIARRVYPVQIALGIDVSREAEIADLELVGLRAD